MLQVCITSHKSTAEAATTPTAAAAPPPPSLPTAAGPAAADTIEELQVCQYLPARATST